MVLWFFCLHLYTCTLIVLWYSPSEQPCDTFNWQVLEILAFNFWPSLLWNWMATGDWPDIVPGLHTSALSCIECLDIHMHDFVIFISALKFWKCLLNWAVSLTFSMCLCVRLVTVDLKWTGLFSMTSYESWVLPFKTCFWSEIAFSLLFFN